MTYEGPVKRQS